MQDPKSAFARLKKSTEAFATPSAQVNEVVRTLEAHGYRGATDPHVEEAWIATEVGGAASKVQFFVWPDTPFGDDVVLATGPSFKPRLAAGSTIRATPGVGMYVQAMVAKVRKKVGSGGSERKSSGREEREAPPERKPSYREMHAAPRPSSRGGLGIPTSAVQRGRQIGETRREEARREAEETARRQKSRAAAEAARQRAAEAAARKAAEKAAAAAREAAAEADRVAREAKAAGENAVAEKAKRAKAEAAEFLAFLKEAAG